MNASDTEAKEELWELYPDVLRVAAGIAATGDYSPEWVAQEALAIVRACRAICTYEPEDDDE